MQKLLLVSLSTLALSQSVAYAKTEFNGDVIAGRPVITNLDVNDLEANKTHEFYFRTEGQNNAGQHYYVPVSVIRGIAPGKNVIFTAGVHANEVNPYQVLNQIKQSFLKEPLQQGTVTLVHQFNIPGLIANQREFIPSGPVKVNYNLNFQANTQDDKHSSQLYSRSIWNGLLKNNADYAIDVHTANPTTFPMFSYAHLDNPAIREMTSYFDLDINMHDVDPPSVPGTFEDAGIPSFTLEVGAREVYQPILVERAVNGSLNFLRHLNMVNGEVVKYKAPLEANQWDDVLAVQGGFFIPTVGLLDEVKAGDIVGIQYDAFGNHTQTYHSPVDGVVTQVVQHPMVESASQLVSLVSYKSK